METALSTQSLKTAGRKELEELLRLTESFSGDEGKLAIFEPTSDVARQFFESGASIRALLAGNRAGKTASLCVDASIRATGIIPPSLEASYPKHKIRVPAFIRLVVTDRSSGIERIVKPELLKWLPPDFVESFSEAYQILTLKNDTKIEFLTYEQDILKHGGTARDYVGFDEIPPPDIYKENKMRVADRDGDIVFAFTAVQHERDESGYVTSNARAIAYFFDNIYLRAGRIVDNKKDVTNSKGLKQIECFHLNTFDNIHIDLDRIREDMAGMSKSDIASRIEGKFQHLVGLVYGQEYDEAKHVIPTFEVSPETPVFCAIDPHPRTPHHVTYMAVDKDNRRFVCDELRIDGLVSELAAAMKALEKERNYWVPWRLIDPIANTPDPITGTSIAQELRKPENGIFCSRSGSKDLFTGIYRVKDAFNDDRLFFMEHCEGHRWEISRYIWSKEKPSDKDDHYMENLRRLVIDRSAVFMDKEMATAGRPDDWRRY